MSDKSSDRIEGAGDQVKGKAKEAWGYLTGDEQSKAEGQMDQFKGQAKDKMADAKDKVDDAVDKLTDRNR